MAPKKKHDPIGQLWSELEKSEERLRSKGGGGARPKVDCYAPEILHDQFDAPIFCTLSNSEVAMRADTDTGRIAQMVAGVIADLDGQAHAPLSPLFGRGKARLEPSTMIEGPHSVLGAGTSVAPAQGAPEGAALSTERANASKPADTLAAKAASFRSQRKSGLHTSPDYSAALDARNARLQKPAREAAPIDRGAKSSKAKGVAIEAPHAFERRIDEFDVPEPRAFRDAPQDIAPLAEMKPKAVKKKRPLWLRILWG